MMDFSQLRTLEQLQAERAQLEQDVLLHEQRVQEDFQSIQSSWQRRQRLFSAIFRAFDLILPRPNQRNTLLSIACASFLKRLFRKRKS